MSYQQWLTEGTVIANKYSLGQMLKGFTPELINLLMQNHVEKIKKADSYENAIQVFNDGLSAQLGTRMAVSSFITNPADLLQLYSLFTQWRARLLSEPGV